MSYHFSTGDTFELKIKVAGDQHVFRTLVEQVISERQYVVYTPLHQGKVLMTQEGDHFEVVFSKLDRVSGRYDIFSFDAVLKRRLSKDHISLWQIERIGDFKKLQRRDYFRLNYVRLLSIELDQRDRMMVEVLSKDISVGGMRCVASQRLVAGEPVTTHLILDPKKPLAILGEVVSSELMTDSQTRYDTRIRFVGITKKLELELSRQINYVQSEMLKKVAAKGGDSQMDKVLAHIDLDKARIKVADDRFDVKLGWWLGVNYLLIMLMFIFYIAARPTVEYPMERFNDIIRRTDWNAQILYRNIGVSLAVLAGSFIGVMADRNHYRGRKPINLFFIIGCFLGLLSLMILTTLFATVF